MGARRLILNMYCGTADEVEACACRSVRLDPGLKMPSIKYVLLRTPASNVWVVMNESMYREEIEAVIALDFSVERFFEAPTGARNKIKRVL